MRSCIEWSSICVAHFPILMRCAAHYKSEIWWSVHLWTHTQKHSNFAGLENAVKYRTHKHSIAEFVKYTYWKKKTSSHRWEWQTRINTDWERARAKVRLKSLHYGKIDKTTATAAAAHTSAHLWCICVFVNHDWVIYIIWIFITVLDYFGLFEARPTFHKWSVVLLLMQEQYKVVAVSTSHSLSLWYILPYFTTRSFLRHLDDILRKKCNKIWCFEMIFIQKTTCLSLVISSVVIVTFMHKRLSRRNRERGGGRAIVCIRFFLSPADILPFVFTFNQNTASVFFLLHSDVEIVAGKLHIAYTFDMHETHAWNTCTANTVQFSSSQCLQQWRQKHKKKKCVKCIAQNLFFRFLAFSTLLLFKFYCDAIVASALQLCAHTRACTCRFTYEKKAFPLSIETPNLSFPLCAESDDDNPACGSSLCTMHTADTHSWDGRPR